MAATIESISSEKRKFSPPAEFSKNAHVKGMKQYEEEYRKSIENPDGYWYEKAEEISWMKKGGKKIYSWDEKAYVCKWFEGWKLNVSYNCLDRHLEKKGDKIALIWQGEPENDVRKYTYKELHKEVCRFANVLKSKGIKKGDAVCIYLPMVPELPIAMLACARIGAIHSVVFGGFSAEALKNRIEDSESKLLVTSDIGLRREKIIPMKQNADAALSNGCKSVGKVIVVKRSSKKNAEAEMKYGRDSWWHDEVKNAAEEFKPEEMDAEDPLFILYTSGTTGKPKGVVHTSGGYLVYVYQTFKWIFDIKDNDVYWCTADIGWVTGHSYIIYGPLANGSTTFMFEGVPDFPKPDRFWQIIDKYKVTIFYTAPTAIRALAYYGDEWPKKHSLGSLRLLGTVGEPINPEAWMWYYGNIGRKKCPIVDTWWQTETGGILITPLPGAMILKPGSANRPFPGIMPAIFREDGTEAGANEGGYLVIKKPWPAMLRTLYKNHEKFKEVYFSKFPRIYLTGDGARKDEDGDFWLMGRIDDVIKVAGHRIGTAEIESALVSHKAVSEAAVVPIPHEIKGQGIYAYVVLHKGTMVSESLKNELLAHVVKMMGPIVRPDKIQFTEGLPKTRSGKIMRRILRKIAEGSEDLGDVTTLADPSVVEKLVRERV